MKGALDASVNSCAPWGHSAEAEGWIGKKVDIEEIFMSLSVLRPQERVPVLMLQHL